MPTTHLLNTPLVQEEPKPLGLPFDWHRPSHQPPQLVRSNALLARAAARLRRSTSQSATIPASLPTEGAKPNLGSDDGSRPRSGFVSQDHTGSEPGEGWIGAKDDGHWRISRGQATDSSVPASAAHMERLRSQQSSHRGLLGGEGSVPASAALLEGMRSQQSSTRWSQGRTAGDPAEFEPG